MGAPIKLESLLELGAAGLNAEQLSPAQSRAIGRGILKRCAPQLKYVQGHKLLSSYLEYSTTPEGHGRGVKNIYPLPRGVTGKDFFFQVLVLDAKITNGEIVENRIVRYVRRREVLLTTDGKLLLWDWHAELKQTREHQIKSEIEHLEDERLDKILSNPQVPLTLLKLLRPVFDETIEARKKRLDSMQEVQAFLSEVEQLITK